MARPQVLISTDAGARLELMLVSGVATVLAIRAFLAATGYPQVGGSGLHIAHLLWGGLGLTIALIIALSVLGARAKIAAALLGGIGFGFFIDEVGKFVTTTNDYFYRPAIGLIYITFVAIALVLRFVRTRRPSPRAALVRALEQIGTAPNGELGEDDRREVLALLEASDQQSPMIDALHAAVTAAPIAPDRPNVYERLRRRGAIRYERLSTSPRFLRLVIAGAVLLLLVTLPALAAVIRAATGGGELPMATTTLLLATIANALVAAASLIGIVSLARRHRLRGLVWLRTSMALSLLLAAPLSFWTEELAALPAFVLTLIAYGALGYAIRRERERADGIASD